MTYTELRARIREIAATKGDAAIDITLQMLRDEWDALDAEAQQEGERILDGLIRVGTENARRELPTLDDGPRKRFAKRAVGASEGRHHNSHDALAVLSAKSSHGTAVVRRSEAVFHAGLQTSMDFLFDSREKHGRGKRSFVLLGLLHGLVDELLVAFHLSQRAFVTQAHSHLRNVEEVLEIVDLLAADAAMLDAWLEGSDPSKEKAVFRKMRKAAGARATHEQQTLFGFLSATGPHAQVPALEARATLQGNVGTFFIVGSPMYLEAANVLVARAAVAFAHSVAAHFPGALHADETKERLDKCDAELSALVRDHAIPLAAQMRVTHDELARVLATRRQKS